MLLIGVNSIILNYVTQLWEKNYWHELRSVRVFDFPEVVIFRWKEE